MGEMSDYYAEHLYEAETQGDDAREALGDTERQVLEDARRENDVRRLLRLKSFKGCGPEARTAMETIKPTQVTANKFYVGSRTALDKQWGHRNLEDAVKHATELLDASGKEQFIVQIVRVVGRRKQPVTVRKVGR